MSDRRLLDWDGTLYGVAHYWHRDGEGNWAQESVQHVDDLLTLNKEAQNHCLPRFALGSDDWRHVSRTPMLVIMKWYNDIGVDYFSRDPGHQRKINDLLNSSEWRWLRTDNSVL